jgi:hypothetical protein
VLPELGPSLKRLNCGENHLPYNDCLNEEKRIEINKAMQLLKKVRFHIMCVKYKKQFRVWLWEKVRRPKAENKYHYANLIDLLSRIEEKDEDAFDMALESWCLEDEQN